jgi:hypothetical protein
MGSAYYIVPKVLKKKLGPKFDAWNIGFVSYRQKIPRCDG